MRAPVVTQLRGSLQVHQQGIIITTGGFSQGARREARASNKAHIGLIDGEKLIELLIKHQVGVLEKTLKIIGLDDEWWEMLTEQAEEPPQTTPVFSPSPPRTGQRPVGIVLFGQTYPVSTWKEVLLKTIDVLVERHPGDFADKATALHGRKRQYIATSDEDMKAPRAIPGTRLWVETNLDARSILRLSRQLLAVFGYAPDSLDIQLKR